MDSNYTSFVVIKVSVELNNCFSENISFKFGTSLIRHEKKYKFVHQRKKHKFENCSFRKPNMSSNIKGYQINLDIRYKMKLKNCLFWNPNMSSDMTAYQVNLDIRYHYKNDQSTQNTFLTYSKSY